uniref:protein Z-dependent protease inhibitor-like n=1 Tax=Pristiophorus japonicus TaxID=55135 RepID=UPI00398E9244
MAVIFQRNMERFLKSVPRTVVFQDDILVIGRDTGEHLLNLEEVLSRLNRVGLKLKGLKCIFLVPEVEFLGRRIAADGIWPNNSKTEPIENAPRPQNVMELRSFLGLLNYFGNFLAGLNTLLEPLHALLCKGDEWIILRSSRQEKMKNEMSILLICGGFMITAIAQQHQAQSESDQRRALQQHGNFNTGSEHDVEVTPAPSEQPESVPDMQTIHTFTAKNNEFGFNLYRKIANLHEDNVFFSPISVSTTFAMLSLGAKQATHDDILRGLDIQELVNTNNQYLLHMLFQWLHRNITRNKGFLISQGSSLFVQDDIDLKPTFIDDLSRFYNADIIAVNFQETANTKDIINQYIRNRTDGKINKLLDSVASETKLMFTNYILFKGAWMFPFHPNTTTDGTFYVNAYTRVKVPMMFIHESFHFTHDKTHSCKILKLPYQGSASMLVVIPTDGEYLLLEDELTAELINRWIKAMRPKTIELYFPKFKLEQSYQMEKKLRQLGIRTPFTNAADFSGISSSYQLKISQVIHKAVIDVDERGTEAAAVTGASMMPYSLPPVIKVDHPFLFMIHEAVTNTLLFIGRVKDPTKL